jgi:Uncharacterised nucleotidyltransferase
MKTTSKSDTRNQEVNAHRPEVDLLLYCARTHIDTATGEYIKTLLQQDIDWEYLTRLAHEHKVLPLLFQSLNKTSPEVVPQAVLDTLRHNFQAIAHRNLLLMQELLRLLKLFDAHQIQAVPFKGPILATAIYSNLALRQFGDLDILVHKKDILKAKELMLSHNYHAWHRLSKAEEIVHLRVQFEYNFMRNDNQVFVELHWGFTPKYLAFDLDSESVWEDVQQVPIAGTKVFNLSPEKLLIILCVHGTKDLWGRLSWICDIAEVVRVHQTINWQKVIQQAKKLGSERMLLLGLYLANKLLQTSVPKEVWQKIQADPVVESLATQVCQQLFCETHNLDGNITTWRFYLQSRENRWDKYRHILFRTFLPTVADPAFLPLPESLFFLYYLLRPLRLLGEYAMNIFKFS